MDLWRTEGSSLIFEGHNRVCDCRSPEQAEMIMIEITRLKDTNMELVSTIISIKDILNKLGEPNPMEQDILNTIEQCLTKHGGRNE